jgi:sulfatase maturation enzyme AslB (radical SAM superfamily)
VAFLERHRFRIQISFDGLPPSQDLRAPGSFTRLDRLIDRLKLRHRGYFRRRVGIAVTVAPPAIPHLADSFDYLMAKGVRQIAISAAMGQGRLSAAQADDLDRQFRRIFTVARRHYRATGDVPLELFQKPAPDRRKPDEGEFACAAADGNNLVVDVDGDVFPCAMLIRSCQRVARPELARRLAAMSLGPVTEPQVLASRLGTLPAAARAAGIFGRQDVKRSGDARCASCRFAGTCLVCPVACARNPDSADPNRIPDYQCAFNRIALDYRRRFPCQP